MVLRRWEDGLCDVQVSETRVCYWKSSRQGLWMGWGKGHTQSATVPEEKKVPQLTWYLAVRSAVAWSPGLPSWGRAGTWGTGGAKGGERSQEWEQPFPRAPLQKRASRTLLPINILVKPMNIYRVLSVSTLLILSTFVLQQFRPMIRDFKQYTCFASGQSVTTYSDLSRAMLT